MTEKIKTQRNISNLRSVLETLQGRNVLVNLAEDEFKNLCIVYFSGQFKLACFMDEQECFDRAKDYVFRANKEDVIEQVSSSSLNAFNKKINSGEKFIYNYI
ncbi:hypothetical protein [Bacillus sp. Marseille-P3800]|uniref:hypothetical protein n=1 Tax=Bacillus sp. Marseille-P3800 TaxID=2014782 RepID=UPI000C07DE5F|nr:hypothetical protein [Bacillus sp. Marseille-P3800]